MATVRTSACFLLLDPIAAKFIGGRLPAGGASAAWRSDSLDRDVVEGLTGRHGWSIAECSRGPKEYFWGSERGRGFTPSKILGEIFQRYLRKFWRCGGAMRNFTMKFFESEQKRGVDWYGGIDLRTYTGKWPGPAQVRSEAPRSPRRATPRTAASPPPFHVEPLTHVSLRIHPDGPPSGGPGRLIPGAPVGRLASPSQETTTPPTR